MRDDGGDYIGMVNRILSHDIDIDIDNNIDIDINIDIDNNININIDIDNIDNNIDHLCATSMIQGMKALTLV